MANSATSLRIGFVSTRLAGTDGVSLESAKWSEVFTDRGDQCFYFAGACDRPVDCSRVVAEAHFEHPQIRKINADLFNDKTVRLPETTEVIHELRVRLKHELHQFIEGFGIQLLVIENALSLPMNVPLGLALTELIAETNIPTIAHHHDFWWERERFTVNAAEDFLQSAFPPVTHNVCHVVINSYAATELARRTGLRSSTVPNVMDFDSSPPEPSGSAETIRQAIGMNERDVFLLQPTRVVPRKCIERSIEFAHWLDMPATLVVSHSSGDEGNEYLEYLVDFAKAMDVRLVLASNLFSYERPKSPDGAKLFSLADAYHYSDLVTYPSRVEGFGNAFLEAIYYRRPIVIAGYEIFRTDIKPKGFQVVCMDGYVTRGTIEAARRLLHDPETAREMADHNYNLARRHYSYSILRKRIDMLIAYRFINVL